MHQCSLFQSTEIDIFSSGSKQILIKRTVFLKQQAPQQTSSTLANKDPNRALRTRNILEFNGRNEIGAKKGDKKTVFLSKRVPNLFFFLLVIYLSFLVVPIWIET